MIKSDPAYDFFRTDAEAQGFDTLADYFRHYGIVPPANYGRPVYKEVEVNGGLDSHELEWLAVQGKFSHDRIDKSWGEPGKTMIRKNHRWDHDRKQEK